MNRAIVLGSTGYVGSAVVKKLLDDNVFVLAVGRKSFDQANKILPLESNSIDYFQISEKGLAQLSKSKKWKDWSINGDTVFYNFSWSGINRLTDGGLSDQLKNTVLSVDAVHVSKEMGCIKYINVGSTEETLFEFYLKNNWKKEPYYLNSINYAEAKLVSRDMSMLTAYLEKVDYIHTRFSVVIDRSLLGNGYIASSLKKLKHGKAITPVENNQLFDIVDLDDLASAYVAIGYYGKNKADYYIGSGNPMKLSEYFSLFLEYKGNTFLSKKVTLHNKSDLYDCFSTKSLLRDTGFSIKKNFEQIATEICKS